MARLRVFRYALSGRRSLRFLLVAVLALCGWACHDTGDIQVTSIAFTGNASFSASQLKAVLATRQSGWLPWSPRHYFDRAEFETDLERLTAFYADRGFPDASVTGVGVDFNQAHDAVRLTIHLQEGAPVVVQDVRFTGFGVLPAGARDPAHVVPLKTGDRLDRDVVEASREAAVTLLKNHGFAGARVDATRQPGASDHRVVVTFSATPGPAMTFGDVTVAGLEHVGQNVVLREVTFAPGDRYRQRDITRTARRLGSLELFQFTHVQPEVPAPGEPPIVPVRVTAVEGKPRVLRLGIGYGSEDKVRGTAEWTHLNFLGNARQLDADGRWSAIHRQARLSLIEPYFLRRGTSVSVSAGAERTNQLTYDSESYGGRVMLTARFDHEADDANPRIGTTRYEIRGGYSNEYLRYGIQTDSLADLSLRSERIALGLDPDTGRAAGTLAALEIDVSRTALDDETAPRYGSVLTLHVGHAAPWLGGTYRFDEIRTEASGYVPAGPVVLAARARFGTLAASDPATVPFSSRYFLGGSTSIRGWGRFEVSPLNASGLPVGGRTMFETSGEVRFPLHGKLGGVVFLDAGNVWANDWEVHLNDLRYAAGPGLRYQTPIGAVRVDLGFQLNPIAGLVINGSPERRHWRLHFSIGQSF